MAKVISTLEQNKRRNQLLERERRKKIEDYNSQTPLEKLKCELKISKSRLKNCEYDLITVPDSDAIKNKIRLYKELIKNQEDEIKQKEDDSNKD